MMMMMMRLQRRVVVTATAHCRRTMATKATTTTMAARYHGHGVVENVMVMEQVELPPMGRGDVQLRFLAAPVNPADLNMIEGVYDIRPPLPAIGGNEGVAIVEAVGDDVSSQDLSVGDWVIPAQPGFGTWRHRAVCGADAVVPVSKDIPADYAAAISVNPCTAYRMLHDFTELAPGDIVVQNGATSAVGTSVIQMAKGMGLHSINIIRDRPDLSDVVERLEGLGADVVVTEEFAKSFKMKELMAKFDRRPRLGLNCVGGESGLEVTRLLSNGAPMVTYGGMSRKPVIIPTGKLIFNDISLHGFWLSRWVQEKPKEERMAMLDGVVQMIRDGHLKMYV